MQFLEDFQKVNSQISDTLIKKCPQIAQKLLNCAATKLSGRGKDADVIGILNGVTISPGKNEN